MPIISAAAGEAAGTFKPWLQSSAPTGWLKCNGAAISRTLYARLFGIIGTTYGAGDGSTTFNLPDFRGEFIRGLDDGRGVDSSRTLGSAQPDDFKSHSHNFDASSTNSAIDENRYCVGGGTARSTKTFSYTGGTETRPRNQAALYIIKF